MKRLIMPLVISGLLISGMCSCNNSYIEVADLVVKGTIYTAEKENNGEASAFAVKDGKYIYVGNDKDVNKPANRNIFDITARVYPPNPLFDPLWQNLMEYMHKRNSSSVKVHEENRKDDGGIKTELPIVLNMIQTGKLPEQYKLGMIDAAILMAADGYGHGKISGMSEERKHTIVETNEAR